MLSSVAFFQLQPLEDEVLPALKPDRLQKQREAFARRIKLLVKRPNRVLKSVDYSEPSPPVVEQKDTHETDYSEFHTEVVEDDESDLESPGFCCVPRYS